MKLCVFPNDPLIAYYEKGEIKDRYYNPKNLFDEIHFISLIEKEVEISKIQKIAGKAKIVTHPIGKISIKNRKNHLKEIISIVREINPDVIRAYNPFIEGWFAANCAKELQKPFFLSLHTQYDFNRKLARKSNLKKFLALKYTEKFIEPFVLETADKITAVFKIIEPYVLKHSTKKPEILHNKIDYEKFVTSNPISELPKPLIISVGNLISVKNHQIIIEAMKDVDAHLLIIGNGELYSELNNLIKKLDLQDKVDIIKSIPHEKIPNYYKSASLFALAYNTDVEGIPMPVMEAMASGLPVIIPYPKEGFSEGLEEVAIFSDNKPDSFANNMKNILEQEELRKKYAEKSKNKAKEFDSSIIEKREYEIYSELITKRDENDM